jgi:hypothetical protein
MMNCGMPINDYGLKALQRYWQFSDMGVLTCFRTSPTGRRDAEPSSVRQIIGSNVTDNVSDFRWKKSSLVILRESKNLFFGESERWMIEQPKFRNSKSEIEKEVYYV